MCVFGITPDVDSFFHELNLQGTNFILHNSGKLPLTPLNALQDSMEKMCPLIMKLGLLHEVDTLKASLEEQPTYVSFEHKSLQELAAAMYITEELEKAENIEVSTSLIK